MRNGCDDVTKVKRGRRDQRQHDFTKGRNDVTKRVNDVGKVKKIRMCRVDVTTRQSSPEKTVFKRVPGLTELATEGECG